MTERDKDMPFSGVSQILTPLKGMTMYGWHFEQNVVDPRGKCYALKASEGSGNRIKVLLYEEL